MRHFFRVLCVGMLAVFFSIPVLAGAEDDNEAKEMAEIQRLLNAEVMAKPFGVEEMNRINQYIAEATKKKVIPELYKGSQRWRTGMTCAHLYGYYARRNCRYYYSYYGYYYPYRYYP